MRFWTHTSNLSPRHIVWRFVAVDVHDLRDDAQSRYGRRGRVPIIQLLLQPVNQLGRVVFQKIDLGVHVALCVREFHHCRVARLVVAAVKALDHALERLIDIR